MKMSRLVAGLLLLLSCPVALAAPAVVAQAEAGFRDDCRAGGGQPAVRPGFITEVDLNGDGQPDYIVDGNRMECRGGMSTSCGASGGCAAEIFMSGPGGYQRAFQDNVYGFIIDRTKQPPALSVQWHKFHCDRTSAPTCVQPLAWNGRQFVVAGADAAKPPAARPQGTSPPMAKGPAGKPEPATSGAAWAVRSTNNVPIAFAAGQDPLRELVLLCSPQGGRPVLGLAFLRAPSFTQAAVTLTAAGRRFDLKMASAAANANVFLADMSGSELPAALAQARDPIVITVNGAPLGTVAAAGAGAQIRAALAPCMRM